jgi:cytochrome c oxidase subunit 1
MYYWFPKMFGKMCNEFWGKVAFWVVFIGFNLAFFVQFIAGTQGMPRRYASYPYRFVGYHRISTVGAYTMGAGLVIAGLNLLHGLRRGKPAPDNPWGANTLEWRSPSPPPHDNFKTTPVADDPYNLGGWKEDPATGGWIYDAEAARKFGTQAVH